MPFRPDPFLSKFGRLRALRQRPVLGYLVAVGSVAAAAAARASLSDLLTGVRYAPFYVAVALTAAVGGGGPGLLALFLSVVTASYLMPVTDAPTTPTGAVATSLFLIIAGVMLTLIWLLNHAIDRIWYQAENTRLILESQPAGVIGVDAEGKINLVNSAVERQLGYDREELFDQLVDQLVPVEMRDRHSGFQKSYMERPEPRMMGAGRDLHAVAKDGSLLPVEIGLNPVSHAGRVGALAVIVDISERKNLERRTQVLANEISHRARNLLTVVQALALRKLPRDTSVEFVKTLDALAHTQKIFAHHTVAPLRPIIEGELAGFDTQTSISGCEVLLTPAAGQDFSLVIHELATNALKHGALSTSEGLISIEGHEGEDGTFRLLWTEQGGPPIKAPPKRTGFGQKVLQEIAKGLRAQLKLDYPPEGLRFEMVVSIDRISNVAELSGAPTQRFPVS
jgi:PAS domain S-box-containing protein